MTRIVARDSAIADGDEPRVAADERDVRGLDRDVGAGADRHAEVRPGERRRVVDAVADHRDPAALGLEPRDRARPCRPGSTSAITWSAAMPTWRATASAVARASPVSSHTSRPGRAQLARPPAADSALTGSAMAMHARGRRRRCATYTSVAPVDAAMAGGLGCERRDVDAVLAACSRALPTSTVVPVDRAARRRARRRPRSRSTWPNPSSRSRAAARRSPHPAGAPSPSRATRRGRADASRRRRAAATIAVTTGRPSVSVPVLSNTTVSIRPAASSASPPRTRIPASAPVPVPTMIAVGVARPMAHGQAMITTPMNAVSASVSRGSGPNSEPDDERRPPRRRAPRGRTTSRDPVGQALDRRLRALGALDQLDDPGEDRVAADARRPHHERAGGVERRADDLVAGAASSTGIGSPVSIDSSTARRALDEHAVDRDLVARPDPQQVAGDDVGQRHVRLARRRASRRAVVGLEPDEPPDRAGRAALGAGLEPSAEQDQADDDRRAVEVGLGVEARLVDDLGPQRDEHASSAQAAVVPTATSVSIVMPPWRAARHAAR